MGCLLSHPDLGRSFDYFFKTLYPPVIPLFFIGDLYWGSGYGSSDSPLHKRMNEFNLQFSPSSERHSDLMRNTVWIGKYDALIEWIWNTLIEVKAHNINNERR